ncbi:MAG: hypothetical protein PVJ34_18870, partial [Anaerolineae bacterium]
MISREFRDSAITAAMILLLVLLLAVLLVACDPLTIPVKQSEPVLVQQASEGICPPVEVSCVWPGAAGPGPDTNLAQDANPSGVTTFNNLAAADLTLSDDLIVGDDTTFTDAIAVTGAATLNGTATLNGAATINNTLLVTGATTINNTLEVTDTATVASLVVTGTTDLQGNIRDSGGTVTIPDDVIIDGASDAVQLKVQANATQSVNPNVFVVENSGGTDRFAVSVAGTILATTGVEHTGLPTILSTSIITTTDGTLWNVGAGELWFVHNVYCQISTNFDCTGDDCILHIGDGGDEDGFLDLDDGELQTTDVDVTG